MRESTVIDWRQRLEDIVEEVESAARDEEDLQRTADLEQVADKLRSAGEEIEQFQADFYG